MIKIQCPFCNHIWDYTGKSKTYVTCSKCHKSIKVVIPVAKNNPFPWTEYDLEDLRELNKKGEDSKTISIKLGIDEDEVKQKIIDLKLQPLVVNTIALPKTITQNICGKERDSIPDIGVLLTKLLNENSVRKQQNDEQISEQKYTNILLQTMVDLQQEYMVVVKEQHEVWKRKQS